MKYLSVLMMILCTGMSHANIADSILSHYKKNLYTLPLVKQEHFSTRMYRITGNHEYLIPVISYIYSLSQTYHDLFLAFYDPAAIHQKAKQLLALNFNVNPTLKSKQRLQKLTQYGDLYFYIYLLQLINKVYSYHLENTPLFPQTNEAIDVLKSQTAQLEEFILNEENIKIYAAQLINYVYYLADLQVIDLKETYMQRFQQTFPNDADGDLSTFDYQSKIYGLTHFITAASRYYQTMVNDKAFDWIGDYLEQNIDLIINKTENDIVAEVGVCLMLMNKQNSPAIKKIRSHLIKQYNSHDQMVPTMSHSLDFVFGEHRNILTIMLFTWPKNLVRGPFFKVTYG